MSEFHKPLGKMENNGTGAGAPSPEQLEERARELAVIAGRPASSVNEGDRAEARLELTGDAGHEPDDDARTSELTSWDEIPGETGQQAATSLPIDEANIGEQLVSEGVDEAAHDQMLEARKNH